MADQKIELEIVLDDGSIKKAFRTVTTEAEKSARESARVFQEEFEKQQFIKGAFDKQNIGNALSRILRSDEVAKSAKDSAEFFSEQFSKNLVIKEDMTFFKTMSQSLIGIASGFYVFNQIRDSISSVTNEFKALLLEAENVRAVNAQFGSLTKQNKINSDEFSEALNRSSAGLLGNEEALQLANNAMIRLGSSAIRLPEIFELSRKAAASGYGDLKSNVEVFTNAVQTSNSKQLRAIGLSVELTKAQQKYANSLGLTTDQLTPQQREFVNITAIIKQANAQYVAIDTSTRSFSDALTRFSVASANVFQKFAQGFDAAFGSTFKRIIDDATFSLSKFAGETSVEQKIQNLKYRLGDLSKEYDEIAQRSKLVPAIIDVLAPSYNESALKNLKSQMEAIRNEITLLSKETKPTALPLPQAPGLTDEQIKLQQQRQQQLYQSQIQFQQQEQAARQQSLQYEMDDEKRREGMAFLHAENLKMIAENGAIARNNIEKQYSDELGFSKEQRDQLILEQVQAQNAQMLSAEQAYQSQSSSQFDQFLARSQKTFKQMGDAAKITFVSQIGGAFAAFGNALAKGENAMEAFGKAMLGILGDIAIQMGQSFILQGIAMSLNPLTPGSGAGLIAAGAALSIFGGFLKGLAGGGGGAGAAAAAGGGGGGIAQPTEMGGGFNAALPMADTRLQPSTVVNFTVQGDILDSDSTQNRIVQLLNDAIDTKGAVVRGFA